MMRRVTPLLFLFCVLATPLVQASEEDPYESFNRKIFAFNEFADKWVLKPTAKAYRFVTPDIVDDGVSNVFDNLGEVRNLVNAGLQGDMRHMGVATGRLLINSTLGLAGLIDVATRFGLEERKEDFGQTLATWGVDSGPYLMLPFLGGRTMRDSVSLIPDFYLSPVTYIEDDAVRLGVAGLDMVDTRADLIDAESLITGDRYTFLREVYLQKRRSDVANGQLVDDFDEEFEDDF